MTSPTDFHQILRGLAESALETPHQQLKLLTLSRFEEFLRKRKCGFGPHGVLDWWRIGLLRPAVIDGPVPDELLRSGTFDVESPATGHRHFADGRPMPAELGDVHVPRELLWDLDGQAWYHPFQLWQAYLVRRHLTSLTVSPAILFGPEERYMELCAQGRIDDRLAIERLLASWRIVDSFRLVSFVIGVSPLVLFRISGQIISDPFQGQSYQEYWRWRSAHDPDAFLAKRGINDNDLRRWNELLSQMAYGLDPLQGWFDLTRHVAWQSWQGVEGEALLVHDLYVMAEVIRRYAEEFLSVELPEEDELWRGPYVREIKQRQYGHPKSNLRRRDVRRRVAREFGLDGDVRLVWIVEGGTEANFAAEYGKLIGVSPDAIGMTIFNIRGDSKLKADLVRQRLVEARKEDQFAHVTLDRNDSLRPTLRRWSEEGLITVGWKMWEGDFESDNFSDDEIAEVVAACANEDGVRVKVDGKTIREARRPGSSTEAAVKACLKGQPYSFAKDARWARKLAERTLARECPAEVSEEGDRRITRLLNYLFRGCSAEFLGSVERYRVHGDTGKIVSR